MTTLVGIVAGKGERGVVIASDAIATSDSWNRDGDVAVRKQEQKEYNKICITEDKRTAIAVAGLYDPNVIEFLHDIRTGKINIEEAVTSGKLNALREMHLARADGRLIGEATNSLLLATCFLDQEPQLYSCWPLGRIEKIDCGLSIGSGSEYALNYLRENLGDVSPRDVDISTAIEYARKAVGVASQYIFTKGLDIAVINSRGVCRYGPDIKRTLDRALDRKMRSICNEYKSAK